MNTFNILITEVDIKWSGKRVFNMIIKCCCLAICTIDICNNNFFFKCIHFDFSKKNLINNNLTHLAKAILKHVLMFMFNFIFE